MHKNVVLFYWINLTIKKICGESVKAINHLIVDVIVPEMHEGRIRVCI